MVKVTSDLATVPPPGLSQGPGRVMRIGVAAAIPAVLRSLGADPDRVIAEAGLDPTLFDDPENPIRVAALGRLVRNCVAQTGCEHFGLLVGQRAAPSALGIVGLLVQNSASVRSALENLVAHLHLHDRGAAPDLAVQGGEARLSYALYEPGVEAVDQITDGAIATACNLLRVLCGPRWRPLEVRLPRARPTDAEPFNRFFGSTVRFDQEVAEIGFTADWLDREPPGADAVLRRILEQRVRELEAVAVARESLSEDLRRQLRRLLPRQIGKAEEVSRLLSMHPRTLHRRLRTEGTAFRKLADEVRFEIARQLLADTRLTLTEIAAALNFSEPSAFTRAFRRWSGRTPSAWRAGQAT